MNIEEVVKDYRSGITNHDSDHSWDQCYLYFNGMPTNPSVDIRDQAALRLAFYLASWGMYRGSSFLPKYNYTIHNACIDLLLQPKFELLRQPGFDLELGSSHSGLIMELVTAIRESYRPFAPESEERQASDTLVTKIILGTYACLPACDRYFIRGFKRDGYTYSYAGEPFVERILGIRAKNEELLLKLQTLFLTETGMRYPAMKLLDMYFWQLGYDEESREAAIAKARSRTT